MTDRASDISILAFAPSGKYSSGVDLCEPSRIQSAIEKHGERFLRRVYTNGEIGRCSGDRAKLAGFWAVKEAVSKALGTGVSGFKWTDIEVIQTASEKINVVLHNSAKSIAEQNGWRFCFSSVSYTTTVACAFVLLVADR